MIATQLENATRLGKFPITTAELNEDDYRQARAELPLFQASSKEECRDVLQTLKHVYAIASENELFHLRLIGVVYVPAIQRFALFAAHQYGMMLVDLMQSVSLATKWCDMCGQAPNEPEAPAWYEADDVKLLATLLKEATDIYATVVRGSLTVVGTIKTGQRYLIRLSKADYDGPPVSLVNWINRTTPVSITFLNVATLAEMKKHGREVVKMLRERQKNAKHVSAELHIFANPDGDGSVFYQFPHVSSSPVTANLAIVVNPFDLFALNPEFLIIPDRGSVSMYVPPAEPKPWEPEGSNKKYVQKPLQLQWSNSHTVTWEIIMPLVPYYLR